MSFTFNGVDFSDFGVEVISGFEIIGATSMPSRALGLPAAARVWYSQGDSTATQIEFPVRIQVPTPDLLVLALDYINATLRTDSDAVLSYWYPDRHWMARWDGVALRCPVLNTCTLQTRIKFLAQPNMFANAQSAGTITITGSPQMFYVPGPLSDSGLVDGNAVVGPVFVLHNTGGDILAGAFQLWNRDTGDHINATDTIPSGFYVRFDTETRRVWVGVDGVNWTEVFGKVTTNWLNIAGGTSPALTQIGCTAGTLSWSYNGRYL